LRWRFSPALLVGNPVPVLVYVEMLGEAVSDYLAKHRSSGPTGRTGAVLDHHDAPPQHRTVFRGEKPPAVRLVPAVEDVREREALEAPRGLPLDEARFVGVHCNAG
jgi:hypothetical protein